MDAQVADILLVLGLTVTFTWSGDCGGVTHVLSAAQADGRQQARPPHLCQRGGSCFELVFLSHFFLASGQALLAVASCYHMS
jgi:hypothetical protein